MDKGIRPAAIAKFAAMLPTRVNTREGNTAFRKGVIAHLEEEFNITHAAGATHYNHAFIDAKKKAETDPALAALLVGLGRPEDKKGGRKPKAKPETKSGVIPVPVNQLLQNFINAGVVQGPAQPVTQTAAAEGSSEEPAPQGDAPEAPAATLYTVFKSVKGTEVATDLTEEQADELIAKAAAAKKSKLEKRAQ